jgi:hypothetical protein
MTWSSEPHRVQQLGSSSLFPKPALEPRVQPKTAHVVLRKPSARIRFRTTVSGKRFFNLRLDHLELPISSAILDLYPRDAIGRQPPDLFAKLSFGS